MHYRRMRNGDTGERLSRPSSFNPGEWGLPHRNYYGYLIVNRRVNGVTETKFQHRLIMEEIVGRELFDHETVHHKNGRKDDNRPGNLELWSCSHPPGQRIQDKVKWARETIELYGDLVDEYHHAGLL